jgi:TolB-like protein
MTCACPGRIQLGVSAVLALLLWTSCAGPASVELEQDPVAYQDEVAALERRLAVDPDDEQALQDLGAIYMKTARPEEAYPRLRQAYRLDRDDPRTLFYLGLATEQTVSRDSALSILGRYAELPEDARFRSLMEGRYQWLTRQQAREAVRQMMARERELADRTLQREVVAVVPFSYQGSDSTYAPLGRGLSEMLTTDLANIDRIRVVERVRLQAVLDELQFAQTRYVDAETAPRVGRLLGAGRLVGGSFNVLGGQTLRIDATLADIVDDLRFPEVEAQEGQLDRLFELEKQVVLELVGELGIQLTPAERDAIEPVPTRSLQAFLAYSQGLLEEDRGNFAAAARQFQRATRLDPTFEAAVQRQQQAQSISQTAGDGEQALTSAQAAESALSGSTIDLLNNRLTNMGASVAGLEEGDERQPAQEQGTTRGAFPDPPDPPASEEDGGQ